MESTMQLSSVVGCADTHWWLCHLSFQSWPWKLATARQLVVRRTDMSQPCWELIEGAKPSRDPPFAIAAAINILDQRSANLFYKGSDCKYSQPCRPSSKGNCQTVLLYHVNSFEQYGNRWAWLSTHTGVIYGNRNLNFMWFWCLINHFLLIIFHRHWKSRDFS